MSVVLLLFTLKIRGEEKTYSINNEWSLFLAEKNFVTIILFCKNEKLFQLKDGLNIKSKAKDHKVLAGQLMDTTGYCKALIRATHWVI